MAYLKAKKKLKVLILGKGTVGRAVNYYLKKLKIAEKISFFKKEKETKNFDILIGALPSEVGRKGLALALKYKKDLIDISAVPISFYLKHKKEILKKGIRVIPDCGVSPGLVNLFSGYGSIFFDKIDSIEIGAGTLPKKDKFFFPPTWCFKDLIEEHLYGAIIVKNGKRIKLPPFSGYKRDKLKEVGEFESYFVEEWSSLFYSLKLKNLSFRVIRPLGFFHFFQYLKNYGFFEKKNLAFVEKIMTGKKKDNVTLVYVKVAGTKNGTKKNSFWQAFSFSKTREKLNSMQKITAIVPVAILKIFSEEKIKDKGLLFMEDMGKNKKVFREILKEIKKEKILIKRIED